MALEIPRERLRALVSNALAEADKQGDTLVAALLARCIEAIERPFSEDDECIISDT